MSESAHPANVARGLSKLPLTLFVNFGLITSAEGAISNPNNSDEAYFFKDLNYSLIKVAPGTTNDTIVPGPKDVGIGPRTALRSSIRL